MMSGATHYKVLPEAERESVRVFSRAGSRAPWGSCLFPHGQILLPSLTACSGRPGCLQNHMINTTIALYHVGAPLQVCHCAAMCVEQISTKLYTKKLNFYSGVVPHVLQLKEHSLKLLWQASRHKCSLWSLSHAHTEIQQKYTWKQFQGLLQCWRLFIPST